MATAVTNAVFHYMMSKHIGQPGVRTNVSFNFFKKGGEAAAGKFKSTLLI